jgi:outer membrane receptor for ferrienterochelin and colicins
MRNLKVSAGYQLLYAKDRGVLDSIKNGTGLYAFVYDPETGDRIRSKTADYFGLINRSRHMANLRFAYENEPTGILASFRINYRGKYGFMESGNRNDFLDPYDTYVPGYFLFNASVQKTMLNRRLAVQLTVDNLFNYSDMKMPAQAGRQMLVGLTYRFFKQ